MLNMETKYKATWRQLENLLTDSPTDIDNIYDFILANKAWICCTWSKYDKAVDILTAAGRDVAFLDEHYPTFGVSRVLDKKGCETTVMFAQFDGVRMPQFNQLQWSKVWWVDFYRMYVSLDEDTDIECHATLVSYTDGTYELLFIEVPEKYRSKGYGRLLLSEIRQAVCDDIFLFSTADAEEFYLKNGGVLADECKEYADRKCRKIVLKAAGTPSSS